jgi:hypothetical protein
VVLRKTTISPEDTLLTIRKASVAVPVNEEIDGLGVSVEALPGSSFDVSEGRFDADSRIELVFHGLDLPTVDSFGTLSIDLPVASSALANCLSTAT